MAARTTRARARKVAKNVSKAMDQRTRAARKAGAARMKKAARSLEKAAAHYARMASEAGAATKRAAQRVSKTRTGKALAAAALAVAGYAAVKAMRKR